MGHKSFLVQKCGFNPYPRQYWPTEALIWFYVVYMKIYSSGNVIFHKACHKMHDQVLHCECLCADSGLFSGGAAVSGWTESGSRQWVTGQWKWHPPGSSGLLQEWDKLLTVGVIHTSHLSLLSKEYHSKLIFINLIPPSRSDMVSLLCLNTFDL